MPSGLGSVAQWSKYLTAVPGTAGNSSNGIDATMTVDAQISDSISDALKLDFETIDLTDRFADQYVDATDRLDVLTHSGRQFIAGARAPSDRGGARIVNPALIPIV